MEPRIDWQDDATGVEEIDAANRFVHQLAEAVRVGLQATSESGAGQLMMALHVRVRRCFDREEEAMRASRYPGLREHTALHDRLMGKIDAASDRSLTWRLRAALVRRFVEKGMAEHARSTDADFARYVRGLPPDQRRVALHALVRCSDA